MHTHAAALELAATRLGGKQALARYLRATSERVDSWTGGEEMPHLPFLRCVEVIIADEAQVEAFRSAIAETPKISFDTGARRAYLDGAYLPLPLTEWSVLESLSARVGQVVSRAQIRRELMLWTGKSLADAIHMYVFRLRLKLAPAGVAIQTIPRTGYVLRYA